MDGLSAAASGIAVVSIAVQSAESVKKLCDFWKSIEEAPEDVQAVSIDLELLSSVLTQIAYEAQHVEPDATFVAALSGCWVKIGILITLLNEVEPGFASTSSRVRKWTAFKTVWKCRQLTKFQEALERLKGTLLLVQQSQNSRLSRNLHMSLERNLVTITQSVSSLSMQQRPEIAGRVSSTVSNVHSTYAAFPAEEWDTSKSCTGTLQRVQSDHSNLGGSWRKHAWLKRTLRREKSAMEYFLGTIRAESCTALQTLRKPRGLKPGCEQDQYEHETFYTIYPATWLIRLGLRYGFRLGFLSSSTQGWKNTLKTFCPVPDDSLIFEFCREGNVPAVQSLLSKGHASVGDTDSRGKTPLHFAAEHFHPELCKILMGAGADISIPTHEGRTPMSVTVRRSGYIHTPYAMLSEVFDTLRLLTDSMDFLDENGDGWAILLTLCRNITITPGDDPQTETALFIWMLRLLNFELKTYFIAKVIANMLSWILNDDIKQDGATGLLLDLGGDGIIDTALWNTDGYTLLHIRVVHAYEGIISVLAYGPDLHQLGFDRLYTPQEESPTSLAMYSERAFSKWRHQLVKIDLDLKKFIDRELERNHLVHAGWEKETFYDLFAYNTIYDHHDLLRPQYGYRICSDCRKENYHLHIQPYWRHLLERIKHRIDLDSLGQAVSGVGRKENAAVESVAEGKSSSSNLAREPDITGNVPFDDLDELAFDSESESGPEPEEDAHGYPTNIPIRSDCIYGRIEMICMD